MNLLENLPGMLTIPEVAELLRTVPAKIEKLISKGEINSAEIAGKVLIPKHFLEEYIAKCCQMHHNKSVEIHTPAPDSQGTQHLTTKISSEVVYLDKQVFNAS